MSRPSAHRVPQNRRAPEAPVVTQVAKRCDILLWHSVGAVCHCVRAGPLPLQRLSLPAAEAGCFLPRCPAVAAPRSRRRPPFLAWHVDALCGSVAQQQPVLCCYRGVRASCQAGRIYGLMCTGRCFVSWARSRVGVGELAVRQKWLCSSWTAAVWAKAAAHRAGKQSRALTQAAQGGGMLGA